MGVEMVENVTVFKQVLLERKVCALTVAANGEDWWAELQAMGDRSVIDAYLDLRDCRHGGCKLLHTEALSQLTPHLQPAAGGWAD
jgi:hypothetical protein